jgi:hypothetical protein
MHRLLGSPHLFLTSVTYRHAWPLKYSVTTHMEGRSSKGQDTGKISTAVTEQIMTIQKLKIQCSSGMVTYLFLRPTKPSR